MNNDKTSQEDVSSENKDGLYFSIIQENRFLRESLMQVRKQLDALSAPPHMVADVVSVKENKTIIKIPNGNYFSVNLVDKNIKLSENDTVLVDKNNLNVLEKIDINLDTDVENYIIMEKPTISWNDIGGLSEQINEIKEVVELPFKHPELIQKIGIVPPKGILLYGKPGTGKTLLAKAVAHEINATFIELVGSELVQKFIGEGAKLVKRIFELARKKTPTIIFIDEIDSVAGKRIELGTSGEREVQRTFMQLLSEMDGFKNMENITVIGATNRIDILDPAILRPGRFDRLIEVPKAKTIEAISQIFKIHTKNLNIENDIDNIIIPMLMDFSGAEIRAICNEAAYFALREKRDTINYIDFKSAINKIKKKENSDDGLFMFG